MPQKESVQRGTPELRNDNPRESRNLNPIFQNPVQYLTFSLASDVRARNYASTGQVAVGSLIDDGLSPTWPFLGIVIA